MRRALAALLLLASGCTPDGGGTDAAGETAPTNSAPATDEPIRIGLSVAFHASEGLYAPYSRSIHWAVREVNARGGVSGRAIELVDVSLGLEIEPSLGAADVEAVLVVGDSSLIPRHRRVIEAERVPVIAVGGDLYTGRQLFRYAFQTTIPVRWQARVIAKYFVADRGYSEIGVAARSPEEADAVRAALADEGVTPAFVLGRFSTKAEGGGLPQLFAERASSLEAAIVAADPDAVSTLSLRLREAGSPVQLAVAGDVPHPFVTAAGKPNPGTVFVAPYTWSGWASMIPRVQDFRERYGAEVGHLPIGPEQEAYDAVMALADALERTEGEGREPLLRALEGFRDETYSSTPVRLGPDDHVLGEESHLGLFTVEAPDIEAPGETLAPIPWRPIMRTFTTDGEKVNFLDRDKRIFFPFWRPKRPSPKYWRSGYGIVSRPTDPLH